MKIKRLVFFLLGILLLFSVSIYAEEGKNGELYSNEVTGSPSTEVTIPVFIKDNPGLKGYIISCSYDPSFMTPLSVERGNILDEGNFEDDIEGSTSTENSFKVVWNNSVVNSDDGLLFTIHFLLDEDAAGTSELNILCDDNNTYDESYGEIALKSSAVSVSSDVTVEDREAANAVMEAISQLPETITLNEKKDVEAVRDAFDALTATQKELVKNLDKLVTAEAAIESAQQLADRQTADAVIAKINEIGTVAYTDESKAKIDAAREAYNALSDKQKELVSNYETLTSAETTYNELKTAFEQSVADQNAADAVVAKINEIGTVAYTDESKAKIDAAREAYNALSDKQKELVSNYETLTSAETIYDELKTAFEQSVADQNAADAVIAKINEIGTVAYTDESKAKIDAARQAYNALSDNQKELVSNYETLTSAETTYNELKTAFEQSAADQNAADAVIAKINEIGTVVYTDESKAKIDAARQAYDALSGTQRALVANFNTLTAAETRYDELKMAAENATNQDTIDRDAANGVIAKINEIGTVVYTDSSKTKIDVARQAYNSLSSKQKSLVTNINILTAAEAKYGELKTAAEKAASQEAADLAAAEAVIGKITAIGTVVYTNSSKTKIDVARQAYNSLSSKQKSLVTNVKVLIAAETKYGELKTAEEEAEKKAAEEAEKKKAAEEAAKKKAAEEAEKINQEPITIEKTPASVKAKVKKNKVTVTWKKIKKTKKTKKLLNKINSIQVQYSTDLHFRENVVNKRIGKKKTKITLKGLQRKTVYYIRVRYVGSTGVSNWSKVKKVITK